MDAGCPIFSLFIIEYLIQLIHIWTGNEKKKSFADFGPDHKIDSIGEQNLQNNGIWLQFKHVFTYLFFLNHMNKK